MEAVDFISSINKISLIAFFVTGGLVIYEFYLFKKEISSKKTRPNIPEFKEEAVSINHKDLIIVDERKTAAVKKGNIVPLIIAIIVFIFFGMITLFEFFNFHRSESQKKAVSPTPIINFIASKGIKIYNENWVELLEAQLEKLPPGQKIFIGLETVPDPNIDKARIRVNKKNWEEEDITEKFNQEKNVFYREYLIGTDEAYLKIEGQLHSKSDGWLGE